MRDGRESSLHGEYLPFDQAIDGWERCNEEQLKSCSCPEIVSEIGEMNCCGRIALLFSREG